MDQNRRHWQRQPDRGSWRPFQLCPVPPRLLPTALLRLRLGRLRRL